MRKLNKLLMGLMLCTFAVSSLSFVNAETTKGTTHSSNVDAFLASSYVMNDEELSEFEGEGTQTEIIVVALATAARQIPPVRIAVAADRVYNAASEACGSYRRSREAGNSVWKSTVEATKGVGRGLASPGPGERLLERLGEKLNKGMEEDTTNHAKS